MVRDTVPINVKESDDSESLGLCPLTINFLC